MQNPRQKVRGPVLIYGPGCFSFAPPGFRGADAIIQNSSGDLDDSKKKKIRYVALVSTVALFRYASYIYIAICL